MLNRAERNYIEQTVMEVQTADKTYVMPKDVGSFYLGRNVLEYGHWPMLMHTYLQDFQYCYDVIMNKERHAAQMFIKMQHLRKQMRSYIRKSQLEARDME